MGRSSRDEQQAGLGWTPLCSEKSVTEVSYLASLHHVMIPMKIICLKFWPQVKFLCRLELLEGFIFTALCPRSQLSVGGWGLGWPSRRRPFTAT